MILVVKTSLGRDLEFSSESVPLTNRACQGTMLKNKIKLKKNEYILEVFEKDAIRV